MSKFTSKSTYKKWLAQKYQNGGVTTRPPTGEPATGESRFVSPKITVDTFNKQRALAEEYTTKVTGKSLKKRQDDAGINPNTGKPRATGQADYVPLESLLLPGTPIIKGIGKVANIAIDAMNPLAGMGGIKSVGKKFKSEIDWAKWNKEIPDNPQLMQEYNTIEQTSKANGTWMKNPDGSAFNGTPEQFVQQNSINFKKAFSDGSGVTYRGDYKHYPELDYNPIFTGDKETALNYTTGNASYWSPFHDSGSIAMTKGENTGGLHELYYKNNQELKINAKNRGWTDLNVPEIDKAKTVTTDDVQNYIAKYQQDYLGSNRASKLKNTIIENVYDNSFKPGTVRILPHVDGNYLKSARGNNGMFDMTNPNIYKAIVPAAIGVGAISNSDNKKQQGGLVNKYQNGGPVKPIKVTDPNDPRLKAYKDSLELHNNVTVRNLSQLKKELKEEGKEYITLDNIPFSKHKYADTYKGDKILPIGFTVGAVDGVDYRWHTPIYKKPVQPYELEEKPSIKPKISTKKSITQPILQERLNKIPMRSPWQDLTMDVVNDSRGNNAVTREPDRIMMPSGEEVPSNKFIKEYGEAAWKRATNQKLRRGGKVGDPLVKKVGLDQNISEPSYYLGSFNRSHVEKFEDGGEIQNNQPQNNMIPINIEKGELLVDPSGKIIRKYRGQSPHNPNGVDPTENFVMAPEGFMVIPKNHADAFTEATNNNDMTRKTSILKFLTARQQKEQALKESRVPKMKTGGVAAQIQQTDINADPYYQSNYTGDVNLSTFKPKGGLNTDNAAFDYGATYKPKSKKQLGTTALGVAGAGAQALGQLTSDGKGPSWSQTAVSSVGPWGQVIGGVSQVGTNLLDKTGDVGTGIGTTIFDPARNLDTVFNSKATTEERVGELLLPGYSSYFGGKKRLRREAAREADAQAQQSYQTDVVNPYLNQHINQWGASNQRMEDGGVVGKYGGGGPIFNERKFDNYNFDYSRPDNFRFDNAGPSWLDKLSNRTPGIDQSMYRSGLYQTNKFDTSPLNIVNTKPKGGLNIDNPAFARGASYPGRNSNDNFGPPSDNGPTGPPMEDGSFYTNGNRGDRSNWFNRNKNALAAGAGFLANSAGSIYDLILSRKGYDKVNYPGYTPEYVNDRAAAEDIRASSSAAKDAIRRSNPSGGSILGSYAGLSVKTGRSLAELRERTAEKNSMIGNEYKRYRSELDRLGIDAEAQNKARWEDIRRNSVGNLGKNAMYAVKDYQTHGLNNLYMDMFQNSYGNYRRVEDLIQKNPQLAAYLEEASKSKGKS